MDCKEAGCFVDASSQTDCDLRFHNRRFSAKRLATCGFLDMVLPAIIGACITSFLSAASMFKTTHVLK
jgi:hypothetical protein